MLTYGIDKPIMDADRMKTFWEMTADERNGLLVAEPEIPYSSRARALAKLWADCEDDEVLMQIKYADEITAINQMMDMQILKMRTAVANTRRLSATWTFEDIKLLSADDE
jgi:hypothetical protein